VLHEIKNERGENLEENTDAKLINFEICLIKECQSISANLGMDDEMNE